MRITKPQLETLINEAVRTTLSEMGSPEAYKRFKELKKMHAQDFRVLAKVGPEGLSELQSIRDSSKDYNEFVEKVGPGRYNSGTGRHEPSNKFALQYDIARGLWDNKIASEPVEALIKLKSEWDSLKDRFQNKGGSTATDNVYGRRRTNVVDTETDDVVGSFADREGSLGS